MPVPIEAIVQEAYGLRIETWALEEIPGGRLLGALFPHDPSIVLNERHGDLFTRVLGPYEFTLAHELGHWIYDADPDQGALFLLPDPTYCFEACSATPDIVRIRETNANKLAAAVLMPADLIHGVDAADLVSHHREYAATWGVSARALEIRLDELGIMRKQAPERHRLL